jgi:hypothetical protein
MKNKKNQVVFRPGWAEAMAEGDINDDMAISKPPKKKMRQDDLANFHGENGDSFNPVKLPKSR